MIQVMAKPGKNICLGRSGENLAREVVFDISHWQKQFGSGTVSLIAQRSKDNSPYPCPIEVDGSQVIWKITLADTTPYDGWCELQYRVGETIVKSEIYNTYVISSLDENTSTPPRPQQGWVDQILDAANKVLSTVGNPPDYEQNDENGPGYIANRPFYSSISPDD